MSFIVEFYVEGLAGRKTGFGQKLNRDANLFFGLNGTGKTSLLNILNSALKSDASLVAKVAFTKAVVVIHSETYNQDYVYTLDRNKTSDPAEQLLLTGGERVEVRTLAQRTRRVRSRGEVGWVIEPSLPKDVRQWQHHYLPITRLVFDSSETENVFDTDTGNYDKIFAEELLLHWHTFFGGVQSEVRSIQQDGIANILNSIIMTENASLSNANVDWELAYERTVAFLQRQSSSTPSLSKEVFKTRYNENSALQKVVELINNIEVSIARALEPKTKLQELITRLFSGNKSLTLRDTAIELRSGDNTPLGLETLSSGEKQLLRILFDAVNSGTSSLIIDEPELSLHIDWQRKLVSAIVELNPGLQLIAATHSPEILAEVDDSKIFKIT